MDFAKETKVSSLFITANVGSIFEDPEHMLEVWIKEFIKTIETLRPKVLALHCQEVGGKNYEQSMKHVEHFIKLILTNEMMATEYDKIRIYLDEDYSSKEHFTALGNFYFIHESLHDVKYYDFAQSTYMDVTVGKEIYSGNIEAVPTKDKAKFPQHFFPECKWSRKGYMRTRWLINQNINIDLINVHLFHDASNFVAMEEYPSIYCKNRRRALQYIIDTINEDMHENVPFLIFGDFNFRTDTNSVIKKLTNGLTTNRIQNSADNNKTLLQYFNNDHQLILTVGKKEFTHSEHQNVFLKSADPDHASDEEEKIQKDIFWLKLFDKELTAFNDVLYEYPITFPPSYPFIEQDQHEDDVTDVVSLYMHTRCPSWCDRILISNTAKQLIYDRDDTIKYDMIGLNACMGDHKPIYLTVHLLNTNNNSNNYKTISDKGILNNDNNTRNDNNARNCTYNNINNNNNNVKIHVTDLTLQSSHLTKSDDHINYNLLHNNYTKDMLSHDPYTPDTESIESYSPVATTMVKANVSVVDAAVSPELLISRLEDVLKTRQDTDDDTDNDQLLGQENNQRLENINRNFIPKINYKICCCQIL